jgi:ubiquinone/menaquinone biosynthesis C-methylase UbiE
MTTREAEAANFNRVARPYRWMEYLTFGRALERCRNHFLPQLVDCRSALVLGDGDGRFLAGLLRANPDLRADAIDTSAAMLRLLRLRAEAEGAGGRLRTNQISALSFAPEGNYDLVVTHFFLDCLTQSEVDGLCLRVGSHLQPGARWVVSDFRIPSGAMRWPALTLVRLLYLAFRLLTGLRTTAVPDHAAALSAAGFARIARHDSLGGLLTSELWEYTPAMQLPPQRPRTPHPPDPVPDPEPASPSLPEPDPGVFHHDISTPKPDRRASSDG